MEMWGITVADIVMKSGETYLVHILKPIKVILQFCKIFKRKIKMDFYLNENLLGELSKEKYLFQIGFGLPFYLPLPDKVPFTSEGNDKFGDYSYILLCIKKTVRTTLQSDEKYIAVHYNEEKEVSYVEMIYLGDKEIETTDFDDVISILLKVLNSWLNAYSFLGYNTNSFTLNRMNLAHVVPFRVINKDSDWKISEPYLGFTNFSFESKRDEITHDQVQDLVNYYRMVHSISSPVNPFKTPELFCYDAISNIRNGQYKEGVVNIQSAMESFLKILYILILQEEGKYNPNSIDNYLNNFKNLILDHLKPKLNATWDWSDKTNILGAYIDNTYSLRNEIVHRGSDATSLIKCYQAIRHALVFREEVIAQVNLSTYKRVKESLRQLYFDRPESFAHKIIRSDEDFRIVYDEKFREDITKKLNKDFGINN